MKKMLVVLAGMAMVCSCSNDDDNNQEAEFFNLEEGNMWVYKRYNVNAEGVENTSGITDTVRVVGQEVVDGETYFKLTHTKPFISGEGTEELLHVDENGHLARLSGRVVHPGIDNAYRSTDSLSQGFFSYGVMDYQLYPNEDLMVEGTSYWVSPYIGYLTTPESEGPPEGIGAITSYTQGIGIVLKRIRFVSSLAYIEDRLVYYELN